MITGLWGKKIGMTQVFSGNAAVPVTVIDVSCWVVIRTKTVEFDGYQALQVGCIKEKYRDQEFTADWLKDINKYFSFVREIKVSGDVKHVVGDILNLGDALEQGVEVNVLGTTKGCGFAGVVRRHDFNGPPASHGSTMGKKTGALSFMRSRGRVIKGKRMPGHLGNVQRVMQGLEVIRVEQESRLVLVKGSVPGKAGSLVYIQKA
jgi:large subunit ribosomal protein L3